jgi:phenylacetate-coenzyme A ligase PaaK-like adenylate-forming protein
MSVNLQLTTCDSRFVLDCFKFQFDNCSVYRQYVELLGVNVSSVKSVDDIPFLPVRFFKTKNVYASVREPDVIFTSSGTSGMDVSRHFVADASVYRLSYTEGFRYFFGDISGYAVLALLPSYLERQGSSLIAMVQGFIEDSGHPLSGFFLHNHDELYNTLQILKKNRQKTLLIGVSFALLDFLEKYSIDFSDLIVMETGGMKGRREEITRDELHEIICSGFGVDRVFSEYGMTELLSQAYSKGKGIYRTPPWMKIVIRDPKDPFRRVSDETTGGVNIIDLANRYSCSFIETQDLGLMHSDGSFEIIGRFDESDIRGCNLMLSS